MSGSALESKRRSHRRASWIRIGIGVVALVASGALVWIIWFSSLLAVQKVDVVGETTLTDAQVKMAAKVRKGKPLVRLDTVRIESRVSSMERVSEVHVTRKWPHTVRIEIVERKAVAWVLTADGIRGVDRFGVEFRDYSAAPKGLVQIVSLPTTPEPRQSALESAGRVIADLRRLDRALYKQVQTVIATTRDAIELDLTKGRTVVWGSAENAAAKVTVLESLLDIDAIRFDVSAPEQPTTRK